MKLNIKRMKTGNKQNLKWFLTASLLTVLTVQSVYQVSSLNASPEAYGEYNMSLFAADDIKTESTTSGQACTSDACTMSASDYSKLMNQIADLTTMVEQLKKEKTESASNQVTNQSAPTTQAANNPAEPTIEERCKEDNDNKYDIKKCIREEKRIAKIEKEKEKRDIMVEKFEERIEKLVDRCENDLACLSDGYSSELSKHTGKRSLPPEIVSKYYREVVGNKLGQSLFSSNPDQLTDTKYAIQSTLQNIPEEYTFIKERLVDGIEAKAKQQAQVIYDGNRKLNELADQKNPDAYLQAAEEVKQNRDNFSFLVNSYSSSISESSRMLDDQSLFNYYRTQYVPDMQKLMSSVYGSQNQQTSQQNTNPSVRVNRDGTRTQVETQRDETFSEVAPEPSQDIVDSRNSRNGNQNGSNSNGKISADRNRFLLPPADQINGIQQNGQIYDKSRSLRTGRTNQ